MKTKTTALAVILTLTAACQGPPQQAEDVSCSELMLTSHNAMWQNALWGNAIWSNAIWSNALWSNALFNNALWHNAMWTNALWANGSRDPLVRQLVEYTVSCALPADQELVVELDGEPTVFAGGLGLAPEWAEGPCDETCRGWVSACLMARVNAKGEKRIISLRGNHPALAVTDREAEVFDRPEATYFGDVSGDPQRLHACLPEGATGIPRVCGDSLEDCLLDVVGNCSDVCTDGACRNTDGQTFLQSISVYLPSESLAERCGY